MRTTVLLPWCGLAICMAAPARAEEDYRAIVETLRACSEIRNEAARMTCYDTHVRPPAAPTASGNTAAAAPRASRSPTGFGSESVPRPQVPQEEGRDLQAQVASIRELQRGKFVLTLADGAEWEFAEAAPDAYNPPRPGAAIHIERGSLGSFRLRYASQRAIRVRRVN